MSMVSCFFLLTLYIAMTIWSVDDVDCLQKERVRLLTVTLMTPPPTPNNTRVSVAIRSPVHLFTMFKSVALCNAAKVSYKVGWSGSNEVLRIGRVRWTVRTTKWNWNKTVSKLFQNCSEPVLFQLHFVVRTALAGCPWGYHAGKWSSCHELETKCSGRRVIHMIVVTLLQFFGESFNSNWMIVIIKV